MATKTQHATGKATPAPKPKQFVTSDGVFHFRTDEGEEIAIKMRVKVSLFRKMTDMNELSALFAFLDGIGDKKSIEQIDDLDIVEATELLEAWSEALAEWVAEQAAKRSTSGK